MVVRIIVLCLVILHAPDGTDLWVDTSHIAAVRPAESIKEHLFPGTKSILYVNGHKFGVTETPDQVDTLIQGCE